MNTIELKFGTKEYIKNALEGQKVLYVSSINQAYTKFMIWYVDKETNELEKVWINPDYIDKKDMPHFWVKTNIQGSWKYCFSSGGFGLDRIHNLLYNLYLWLGWDLKDVPEYRRLN
jgi:hypothetical protein